MFKRKKKVVSKDDPTQSIADLNICLEVEGRICRVSSLTLVEKRPFYDTTWIIGFEGIYDDFCYVTRIVRWDNETMDDMINLLIRCKSIEDVAHADEKNSIFYD